MARRINTFGSVCSGIEAASFVLSPMGVKPVWLSEIAEFPKKFLHYKYPSVPNLGDMNEIPGLIAEDKIPIPDFLCGGTPCQAFSLAGWKNGLNDDRGQLTLKYFDILNAIDIKRKEQGLPRALFLWENVEGVLKDKTNAFGYFLAGLLNLDNPIEIGKWPNAGVVLGKQRNVAWRILDAKYFGVPQQRKRLYVVGGGKDFDPFSALFESGEKIPDPYAIREKSQTADLFDFDEESNSKLGLEATINGHKIEVFRQYSDCLYAAYGTKWNGNAASFNGSLFVCQDGRVRRLTPLECERLMGFPDNYTDISPTIRVTNRYQAVGNSWAIPVVKWIMGRIINSTPVTEVKIGIPAAASNEDYSLYVFDSFTPAPVGYINASTFHNSPIVSNMLDIIDTNADEKFYLSPAGCAGIVRRKIERNVGINDRLEFHLRNGFKDNPELICGKNAHKETSDNTEHNTQAVLS